MILKRWILMDKADENGSPSGYGSEAETTTSTTEGTEEKGNTGDSTAENASSSQGTQDKAAGDSAEEKDLTGYDKKDDKGDAKDEAVKDDKPFELENVEGLAEEKVKEIQEFAKAHKLSKEQAQGLVQKYKADEEARAKRIEDYKVEEAKVFKKWETELKEDPEFGGQNFNDSVHGVNRLIREELPGLKNLLTTSGKRLPPSLMKDLNKVARKFYGETEFNQGDRSSESKSWHPTDFYKQKQ